MGVVHLSRGAEGPRSREAKARGRSYEWVANIVFCDSQVGAGVPSSLYISLRGLFSKVCRFMDTSVRIFSRPFKKNDAEPRNPRNPRYPGFPELFFASSTL